VLAGLESPVFTKLKVRIKIGSPLMCFSNRRPQLRRASKELHPKGFKVGACSSITQLFSQNSKQALPLLRGPALNIAFIYADELLLFKQTYLRRRSTLLGQ
jgi:hypothetical protein